MATFFAGACAKSEAMMGRNAFGVLGLASAAPAFFATVGDVCLVFLLVAMISLLKTPMIRTGTAIDSRDSGCVWVSPIWGICKQTFRSENQSPYATRAINPSKATKDNYSRKGCVNPAIGKEGTKN